MAGNTHQKTVETAATDVSLDLHAPGFLAPKKNHGESRQSPRRSPST